MSEPSQEAGIHDDGVSARDAVEGVDTDNAPEGARGAVGSAGADSDATGKQVDGVDEVTGEKVGQDVELVPVEALERKSR